MTRCAKPVLIWCLALTSSLSLAPEARPQSSVAASRPPAAVTILDSTKAQDGLNGSVRRVKTEFAKLQLKAGQVIEGPRQLVEITTYDVAGKRIENASYPVANSSVGTEEYKYDDKGNIAEMTMRGDGGSILSRETYTYEFDRFGNWTKMVTNLVVFESGVLTQEPIEVTYRSLTYYFDDSIARIVNFTSSQKLPALPSASNFRLSKFERLDIGLFQLGTRELPSSVPIVVGEPPPQLTTSTGSEVASEPDVTVRNAAPKNAEPGQKEAFQLFKTGRDRFDVGNVKGAVEAYLRSIELEPTSAEVHLSLGQAYLILKKDKDALRAFRECLRLNPNVAEAHYGMGLSSFRMGHHLDAANAFKRATLLSPKLAKAHYGLALSYQEIGNQSGVIDEYRVLQTLDSTLAKQLSRTFPEFDLPCRVPPYCK